jgi:hypothetical protein
VNIFDLSGLAKLAGVPLLQARNWTSGRPLRIRPSVQIPKAKRTRSLYGETEVFKLAIANRLRHGGVVFRAIRAVLDRIRPEDFVYGDAKWLFLVVSGDDIRPRAFTTKQVEEEIQRQLVSGELSDTKCACYFIELSYLLLEVKGRIDADAKEQGHDTAGD